MWLCFGTDGKTPIAWFLCDRTYVIGRSASIDIPLDVKVLSRHHISICFPSSSDQQNPGFINGDENPTSVQIQNSGLLDVFVDAYNFTNKNITFSTAPSMQFVQEAKNYSKNEPSCVIVGKTETVTIDQKQTPLPRFHLKLIREEKHIHLVTIQWLPWSLVVAPDYGISLADIGAHPESIQTAKEQLHAAARQCGITLFQLPSNTNPPMSFLQSMFSPTLKPFVAGLITTNPKPSPWLFAAIFAGKPVIGPHVLGKHIDERMTPREPPPNFTTPEAIFSYKLETFSQSDNRQIERLFETSWNDFIGTGDQQQQQEQQQEQQDDYYQSSSIDIKTKICANPTLLHQRKQLLAGFYFVTIQKSVHEQLSGYLDLLSSTSTSAKLASTNAIDVDADDNDDEENNNKNNNNFNSSGEDGAISNPPICIYEPYSINASTQQQQAKTALNCWINRHCQDSSKPHILVIGNKNAADEAQNQNSATQFYNISGVRMMISNKMAIARIDDVVRSLFDIKRHFKTFAEQVALITAGQKTKDRFIGGGGGGGGENNNNNNNRNRQQNDDDDDNEELVPQNQQQQQQQQPQNNNGKVQRGREDDAVNNNNGQNQIKAIPKQQKSQKSQQMRQQSKNINITRLEQEQEHDDFDAFDAEENTRNLLLDLDDAGRPIQPSQEQNRFLDQQRRQRQKSQQKHDDEKNLFQEDNNNNNSTNSNGNNNNNNFLSKFQQEVLALHQADKEMLDRGYANKTRIVVSKTLVNRDFNKSYQLPDLPCFRKRTNVANNNVVYNEEYHRQQQQQQQQQKRVSQKTFKKQKVAQPSMTTQQIEEMFVVSDNKKQQNNNNNNNNNRRNNNNNNNNNKRMVPVDPLRHFQVKRIDGDDIVVGGDDDENSNNGMMMMMNNNYGDDYEDKKRRRESDALSMCFDQGGGDFMAALAMFDDEGNLLVKRPNAKKANNNAAAATRGGRKAIAAKADPVLYRAAKKKKGDADFDDDDDVDGDNEDVDDDDELLMMMGNNIPKGKKAPAAKAKKASPKRKPAANRGKKGAIITVDEDDGGNGLDENEDEGNNNNNNLNKYLGGNLDANGKKPVAKAQPKKAAAASMNIFAVDSLYD